MTFLSELEYEISSTQKILERVPRDKMEWQPHEKAMTLGQLALHVASIPGRIASFAKDGATTAEDLVSHPQPRKAEEILAAFTTSISQSKEILAGEADQWDSEEWTLTQDDTTLMTLPKLVLCRLLMLNHWYHHRGQLVTYLRILDVAIPSVYGPSADENPFG